MIRAERGAIVVVALLTLGVLSVLAGAWLRVVEAERDAVRREERVIQAEFLADGAVERVLAWFADPSTFGGAAVINETGGCRPADPGEVFLKRCVGAAGLPDFKSAEGHAQFAGTWDRPDLIYSWDPATDPSTAVPGPVGDAPPRAAWPPAVRGEVRILAPDSPDAVATVVSRVMVGPDADVTMRVELIEGPWRGVPGAIHAGAAGLGPLPVRVHWGDILVDGQKPGVWGYEALRGYAQREGRYFTTRRGTGLLYPDDREPGLTPGAALASLPGDRKFVFVDTLDRQSPGTDNMETLRFDLDRADADVYVGAHAVLTGLGGRSVVVDAPHAEGALARIHYVGALLVAGTVETSNPVNVFGAVAAGRGFVNAGELELWYDSRLATGYRKGFAPVLVKPGSRRRIASPDAWAQPP